MRKVLAFLIFFLSVPLTTFAQEMFEQGKHYTVLSAEQPTDTGDKVEVRELFWYGCPHCFKLENALETWVKNMPDDAEIVRMPAIFSQNWEQHAKLYYTLEAMGNLDTMHAKVFNAIHIDKQKLTKESQMIDFAVENGINESDFTDTFESFSVASKVSAAKSNIANYEVTGVPAFVIGGKYLTSVTAAGSEHNMFAVIEFLINKSRTKS